MLKHRKKYNEAVKKIDRDKTYSLEEISMKNLGGDDGATIGEITAKLMQTIIKKAAADGRGILPDDFSKNLSGVTDGGLKKIGSDISEGVEKLGKSLFGGKK